METMSIVSMTPVEIEATSFRTSVGASGAETLTPQASHNGLHTAFRMPKPTKRGLVSVMLLCIEMFKNRPTTSIQDLNPKP